MAVDEEDLKEDLARARKRLDSALESLAARGVGPASLEHLRESARLLEAIRQRGARDLDRVALRGIAARAARAGQLLDAAAAFYCGWWQASPALAGDYTPEGVWAPGAAPAGAGLALEA